VNMDLELRTEECYSKATTDATVIVLHCYNAVNEAFLKGELRWYHGSISRL